MGSETAPGLRATVARDDPVHGTNVVGGDHMTVGAREFLTVLVREGSHLSQKKKGGGEIEEFTQSDCGLKRPFFVNPL